MDSKLQQKIFDKYKEGFTYLNNKSSMIIPIQFGIECGNGWYWLISNTLECIFNYTCNNNIDPIQIVQIKEKYGQLRIYYNGGDNYVYGIGWLAEHLSLQICENCGSTNGVTQTKGWITTLCKKCMEEINGKT